MDDWLRMKDLEAAYKRGNHKSVIKNEQFLSNALIKEVELGWNLILPEGTHREIPGLILNPMGVASHVGIDHTGEFVPKNRVTHDLSFPGKCSGHSVNSQIRTGNLEPCIFSYFLLRLIHYRIALRTEYPNQRIWIRKEDFKSAFRRLHMNSITSI